MPQATPRTRDGYQLVFDDPHVIPLSIVISPQQSMLAVLREVARSTSPAKLSSAAKDVGVALRPRSRTALRPFAADRCRSDIPDVCVPLAPITDTTVAQQAEQLHRLPDETLIDDLLEKFGADLPPPWAAVADNPRRWLTAWAAASIDAWSVAAHRWQAATQQLDREIRRVSIAAARGGTAALLNTLHPQLRYQHGALSFIGACAAAFPLGTRRLVLVPMITGRDGVIVSFDQPELAYIAYPLDMNRSPNGAGHEDLLTMVMGSPRAAILRVLNRPHTVGALAARVGSAITATIYHCNQLERAELLSRTRHGREVLVSRTPRGDELLDVLQT